MSTRIVEKEPDWCESEALSFLEARGYDLDGARGADGVIRAWRAKKDNRLAPRKPGVRLRIDPLGERQTRLSVTFGARVSAQFWATGAWVLPTFGPFLVWGMLPGDVISDGARWWILAGCIAWGAVFGVLTRAKTKAFLKRCLEDENAFWQYLDPEGTNSHEIVWPGRRQVTFYRGLAWGCLLLAVVGMYAIVAGLVTTEELPSPGSSKLWIGVVFFFAGTFSLTLLRWLTSSWGLPHRYHWKARFGIVYLRWWIVACFPALAVGFCGFTRATLPISDPGWRPEYWVLLAFAAVLVVKALGGFVNHFHEISGGWKGVERPGGYFAPPSTRYEELSEHDAGDNAQGLLRKHRAWTWGVFLFFTGFWYLGAGYMTVLVVQSLLGIFGVREALAQSWYWPVVFPVEGRGAAAQVLVTAGLAGVLPWLSVVQNVRSRVRMSRRAKLGRELATGAGELALPDAPLARLSEKLGQGRLRVVLVPTPEINVQIAGTGIFRRDYVLSVSVGAQKRLSYEEMRALLWHECGHADLLTRGRGRELAALLAPWAPRFLDLSEDLYEHERRADEYAVDAVGDAGPFLSALRKLKEAEITKNRNGAQRSPHQGFGGVFWNAAKMVWSPGWAGYLHPDLDQRIAWLQDTEQKGVDVQQNPEEFVSLVSRVAGAFVRDEYPDEAGIFDSAAEAFGDFLHRHPLDKEGIPAELLSFLRTGLGFAEGARDAVTPIVLSTTAEVLRKFREEEPDARELGALVGKAAAKFGAWPDLTAKLVEHLPRLCAAVQETSPSPSQAGEQGSGTADTIEPGAAEFALLTHERQEPLYLSLEGVADFKRKHSPKDFFVWIDESEGEAFVDGEAIPAGKPLRKVLALLVRMKGQRVRHGVFIKRCGNRESWLYEDEGKTARRWVSELKRAAEGKLDGVIETRQGGFAYVGSASFCIIEPHS